MAILRSLRPVTTKNHGKRYTRIARSFGPSYFFLVGHDFGGPIAYALAATFPESVRKLAVFESIVLLPAAEAALPAWFVTFFPTPDIPEVLLRGHEREFLKTWMNQLSINKYAISEEDLDEYARTYALPGTIKAGAELYRAFPRDIENNRESFKEKLKMPVLAFGAENVMKDNTLKSFQAVCDNVRGGVVPDCGHYVLEERPDSWLNSY